MYTMVLKTVQDSDIPEYHPSSQRGLCFREAFESVIRELKEKDTVAVILYADTPSDASFGGLGEHLKFTRGGQLPMITFSLGEPLIAVGEP